MVEVISTVDPVDTPPDPAILGGKILKVGMLLVYGISLTFAAELCTTGVRAIW